MFAVIACGGAEFVEHEGFLGTGGVAVPEVDGCGVFFFLTVGSWGPFLLGDFLGNPIMSQRSLFTSCLGNIYCESIRTPFILLIWVVLGL
jgi:hypothetical protein